MTGKYPYVTGKKHLITAVDLLRKSFPAKVNVDVLKKFGCAPKNETYVINTLRFLEIIDNEGNKSEKAGEIFALHNDESFQKSFSELVKAAYSELFSLHKESTWSLASDDLISYFRKSDQTTATVGKLQARTFLTLADISGHQLSPDKGKRAQDLTKKDKSQKKRKRRNDSKPKENMDIVEMQREGISNSKNQIGLTVRIEINLPANGNQETYDNIFRSIRDNLING